MFAVTIGAIDLQGWKKCVCIILTSELTKLVSQPFIYVVFYFPSIEIIYIYLQRSSKTNHIFGNPLL